MAETSWTGVVGMITGVIGSILGGLGYREAKRNRLTDLRLKLRQDVNVLRDKLEHLPALMERAHRSRQRVTAAQGIAGGGAAALRATELAQDSETVEALRGQCGDLGLEFDGRCRPLSANPVFKTTIPAPAGMTGGPVCLVNHDRSLGCVGGLLSSSPMVEGD